MLGILNTLKLYICSILSHLYTKPNQRNKVTFKHQIFDLEKNKFMGENKNLAEMGKPMRI